MTERQLAEEAAHRLFPKVHIITRECCEKAIPNCSVGRFMDEWINAVADIIEEVYRGNVQGKIEGEE